MLWMNSTDFQFEASRIIPCFVVRTLREINWLYVLGALGLGGDASGAGGH